ncbi:MAG: helix-turn-helix domain-containing protein [Brachymonas sp.]
MAATASKSTRRNEDDRFAHLARKPVPDYAAYTRLVQEVKRHLPQSKSGAGYGLGRDISAKDFTISADDLVLPVSHRPVVWHDLINFRSMFNRTNSDVVTDFGFAAPINFLPNIDVSRKGLNVMARSYDILYRIYMVNPGPCSWENPKFRDTFEKLYGEVVDSFDSSMTRKDVARRAFQMRFAAIFGISPSTVYRWFGQGYQPTNHQTVIQRKLIEQDSPLACLETFGALVCALRGVDLNAVAPVPTLANLESMSAPRDGRLGRVPRQPIEPVSPNDSYAGGSFG